MNWLRSHRFDGEALPLADRHYNRQKPGTPQFVPPGRCLVFLTPAADALWVTSWPFAEFTKHAWAGAWVNSCFRNESAHLSSDLIREAIAATRAIWPEVPPLGIVTFVDATKIALKPDRGVGRCYLKAGFSRVGYTEGGLVVFQMLPAAMPTPIHLPGSQVELFA